MFKSGVGDSSCVNVSVLLWVFRVLGVDIDSLEF